MRARVSFLVTFIPKFLHALISQDEIPILVDRHGVRLPPLSPQGTVIRAG